MDEPHDHNDTHQNERHITDHSPLKASFFIEPSVGRKETQSNAYRRKYVKRYAHGIIKCAHIRKTGLQTYHSEHQNVEDSHGDRGNEIAKPEIEFAFVKGTSDITYNTRHKMKRIPRRQKQDHNTRKKIIVSGSGKQYYRSTKSKEQISYAEYALAYPHAYGRLTCLTVLHGFILSLIGLPSLAVTAVAAAVAEDLERTLIAFGSKAAHIKLLLRDRIPVLILKNERHRFALISHA